MGAGVDVTTYMDYVSVALFELTPDALAAILHSWEPLRDMGFTARDVDPSSGPSRQLLRTLRARDRKRIDHILSYYHAPQRTSRENIENTIRTRRLLREGTMLRMPDDCIPKRMKTHELNGMMKRRQGAKEKDYLACVKEDARNLDIGGD